MIMFFVASGGESFGVMQQFWPNTDNAINRMVDGCAEPADSSSICSHMPHNSPEASDKSECTIGNSDACKFAADDAMLGCAAATKTEVGLLRLIEQLNAPLYSFQKIMEWAHQAHADGYNFAPAQSTYKSQIQAMQRTMNMHHLRPTQVLVDLPLPDHQSEQISITTFNFTTMLHSLLSDKFLNTPENLTANPDNPFAKHKPPGGVLSEVHSGSWYRHAWSHMAKHTNKNLLIGIILYTDKTVLALSGKLAVHPVNMSLTIFKESVRRSASAWRTLGCMPIEDAWVPEGVKKNMTADMRNERLHLILAAILRSFQKAQSPTELNNMRVRLGNTEQLVNLCVPLACIIGDVEGGQQLTGHAFSSANINNPRLCRTCDVSLRNATNIKQRCNRTRQETVKRLAQEGNHDALGAMCQRPTHLAFFDLDCGNDPFGIFSMVMTEGLHAVESGIVACLLQVLCQQLPKKQRQALDIGVAAMANIQRQNDAKAFPRVAWKEGVTGLTHLQACEKVAKLFAITLFASTTDGAQFFASALTAETWRKMLHVFQMVLACWAWLKKETCWKPAGCNAMRSAQSAADTMMRDLNHLFPREQGMGWNLTKVHEQRHVPEDIMRFGKHKNYHSGPAEHNHISLVKEPAHCTQRRAQLLDQQLAARLCDRMVIDAMQARIEQADAGNKATPQESILLDNNTNRATKGTLTLWFENGDITW